VNRNPTTGVWLNEAVMNALAASFPGRAVSHDESLAREFEQRLADCPKLAYRVALGVLHNTAEAEDVAQEAMLRAYRNFHRLRDRERFRGWLVRSTFRLALDRIRSKNRRERHETNAMRTIEGTQREASVESLVASREFEQQVARALDALPEKLRIVMVLAAIKGFNTREVSKLAGLPEGTVKSRLFLARKKMAESLQCLVKNTPVG
jgi:RNA polymerase sigma-70 factor (ECF subfamily)